MRLRIPHLLLLLLMSASLMPAMLRAQVVINEIMYLPETPEPEWVELFNAGETPLDLEGWSVQDAGATEGAIISTTIVAGGYLVLTRDTAGLRLAGAVDSPLLQVTLPLLNNGGDVIVLRNHLGVIVDSLKFEESWGGGDGTSLERRSADYPATHDTTWGSCIDQSGATPGRRNSLASVPESGVLITEIMFDPLPAGEGSGAEYLELYNTNLVPISPEGWKLYDATAKAQATLPSHAPPIAPGGRLLLASDSTIYLRFPYLRDSSNVLVLRLSSFGLNADGDQVVLRNRSGATVDSLAYTSKWHRKDLGEMKGVALERISLASASTDPRNWSSSSAPLGGTPGGANSVEIAPTLSRADLTVAPPTLSPDGDGYEDFTRISYRLPTRNARIVAVVYDRHGRSVRRLANNEPAGAEGELIWDGRDDEGRPLASGIFVVRLEAYDDGGEGLFVAQGTIVVARRL